MKIFNKIILFSSVMLVSLGSCKKDYLERKPSTQVPIDEVFETVRGAEFAIQGINSLMYTYNDHDLFGQKTIDLIGDMMGEDMPFSGRGSGWFVGTLNYSDSRVPRGPGSFPWTFYFRIINNTNRILVNIDEAKGEDEDLRMRIKAQALTYRAFAYYQLSLFYQHTYLVAIDAPGLPIYKEPTTEGNPRATMRVLYEFIENDLTDAIDLFNASGYTRGHISDINLNVTQGIAARFYLAKGDFANAASMAAAARSSYTLMSAPQLLTGFNTSNNPEWIWGSVVNQEQFGIYGSFVSHMILKAQGYASLGSQKLINRNLYNFNIDPDDVRHDWWAQNPEDGYLRFSQKKFKTASPGIVPIDLVYMRASEMILIEAEAKAHMYDVAGASAVLKEMMDIRLPGYTPPVDRDELIREILLQRRIELWGEGFRFHDIKRIASFRFDFLDENEKGLHRHLSGGDQNLYGGNTNISDPLSPLFLFQIPGAELDHNDHMVRNP